MEDYKANSHKSKENQEKKKAATEKKVEKVINGKVVKKTNNVRKLTDIFISEDVKNVKSYVVMDVLVPSIKKAVSDIVTNGINMILYGESGGRKSNSNATYVSYNKYSDRDRRPATDQARTAYSYDDIVLETRGEAEEVLSRMDELIDAYGVVSVADLYDLVGISCNYTDAKYGWFNIRSAEAVRVRDGYVLRLPRAVPID